MPQLSTTDLALDVAVDEQCDVLHLKRSRSQVKRTTEVEGSGDGVTDDALVTSNGATQCARFDLHISVLNICCQGDSSWSGEWATSSSERSNNIDVSAEIAAATSAAVVLAGSGLVHRW